MTISNSIKKRKPVYSDITCECGKLFTPLTSRNKHCSPECRFKSIAKPFIGVDGCWEWPKGFFKQTGYGQFAIDANTPETSHRMSYLVFNGCVASGLYVCHKCDNRRCFNPDHLFLGTSLESNMDMWSKGRQQKYINQPYGATHQNSKLSEDDVVEILTSSSTGLEMSKKLGVSTSVVSSVRTRKTWRHIGSSNSSQRKDTMLANSVQK